MLSLVERTILVCHIFTLKSSHHLKNLWRGSQNGIRKTPLSFLGAVFTWRRPLKTWHRPWRHENVCTRLLASFHRCALFGWLSSVTWFRTGCTNIYPCKAEIRLAQSVYNMNRFSVLLRGIVLRREKRKLLDRSVENSVFTKVGLIHGFTCRNFTFCCFSYKRSNPKI